jgi:hypothetical protein
MNTVNRWACGTLLALSAAWTARVEAQERTEPRAWGSRLHL